MVYVRDIMAALEEYAPVALQMSYDNSGLQVGRPDQEVHSVLLAVDLTSEVLQEAVHEGAGMVVVHHPLLFHGLKRLTGSTPTELMVEEAIRCGVAVYAAHTNMDVTSNGVSWALARRLGLDGLCPLSPASIPLLKLVVFVPPAHLPLLRQALFDAGCGHIGRYDQCSFQSAGSGNFRGQADTRPFAGAPGVFHEEPEMRLETVFPAFLSGQVIAALKAVHPYEEPAFDLYPLENAHSLWGSGVLGRLPEPISEQEFLLRVRQVCGTPVLRHSGLSGEPVRTIAVCGGSGSELIRQAATAGADMYVTADLKYHDFSSLPPSRGTRRPMVVVDAGHFETEQFTKEIFYEVLTKKFPNFAVCFSKVQTNPVNYF
jgi:dinuclear metal center YbgI/SA1388 family protein